MARMTGPIRPGRHGLSRIVGVLLGFACVLGLYLLVQAFLGSPDPVTEPGPDDQAAQTGTRAAGGQQESSAGRAPIGENDVESVVGYKLRCLEMQTRERLEGVRAFDLETRQDLGVSDYEGYLTLPGIPSQRILLYGNGFLYRMLVDQATAILEPGPKIREVEVYRDRYTLSLDLRTDFPGQVSKADRIFLMVHREDSADDPLDGSSFPTAIFGQDRKLPPRLRRAWLQHRILATMDPAAVIEMKDAPAWVIGEPLLPLLLPITGGRLRFAQVGTYTLRAWTSDGHVARQRLTIRARERGRISLQFRPGKRLRLRIQDGAGEAVAQARVYLSLDRPGEEREERDGISGSAGDLSFAGLFGDESMKVRVEAAGYEILELPVKWTEGDRNLNLQRLATRAWRIQVREKGSGDPLVGVHLSLQPEKGGKAQTGTTDDRGGLVLLLAIGETSRLELRKKGFVDYAEMIDSSSMATAPDRFDMIPSSRERQARLGLICLLEGSAPPEDGALVTLMIRATGLLAPGAVSMRRFLSGHRPESKLESKLDAKGNFRLWTDRKGEATLVLLGDSGRQVRDILLVPGKILHPRF